MSESFIRVVPADQHWQPTSAAAYAAVAYAAGLFSGPGDNADEVTAEFHDRVSLIPAGEYLTRIGCPRCGGEIDVMWLYELVPLENGSMSFDDLRRMVPCCGEVVSLDALHYDCPVGFARFELVVRNGTRDQYELDDAELAEVADLLGHPVTQILDHV